MALALRKAAAAAALAKWASLALPHLAVMHWRLAAMESHHLSQGLLLREPAAVAVAARTSAALVVPVVVVMAEQSPL